MFRAIVPAAVAAVGLVMGAAGCSKATLPGPATDGDRMVMEGKLMQERGQMMQSGEKMVADGQAQKAKGEAFQQQGKLLEGDRMVRDAEVKITEGEAKIAAAREMKTGIETTTTLHATTRVSDEGPTTRQAD